MTGSESEWTGGPGRGKSLAWRSRSSRDMAKVTGRESGSDAAGSASGRDIGKNIANWWTSAVEQTSTFIMDEVPATFVGLSVGAKELKPALTRGSSFSSFTLPWKATGDGSKGAGTDSVAERQDNHGVAIPVLDAPKRVPSILKSPRLSERSHSRKLTEKAHDHPFPASSQALERAHSLMSSPKRLERSQSRKLTEKGQDPPMSSPKRMERPQSRKVAEKGHESSAASPKRLERSPLNKPTKQMEMPHEPIVSSPKQLETPKQMAQVSSVETSKQLGKSPLSGLETPKPSESSPGVTPDPRTGSTGRQGESRRRTKRMVVDTATSDREASPAQAVCLSTVSQEFLLGEGTGRATAKVHSLEVLQRQQFWTPQKARTDNPDNSDPNSATKPTGKSSRRSSASRSLARSLHLDEGPLSPQLTAVGTPPELTTKVSSVGVVLPRDEIFPGKTTSLPQIKVRTPRVTEPETNLSKDPIIGGSTRVPERDEILDVGTNTLVFGSLPTSPRAYTSGPESRTSKLLRRLKFTVRGSRTDEPKLGKATIGLSRKQSAEDLSGTLEPRQLDFSFMNWTDPDLGNNMLREQRAKLTAEYGAAERSEMTMESGSGGDAVSSSVTKERRQQGNVSSETAASSEKRSSSWPWTFKWKWGSKSARLKTRKGAKSNSLVTLSRPNTSSRSPDKCKASPSADIMSDTRDIFVSRSDRFSNANKQTCDRAPKHRRVLSWGADTTSALCSGSNPSMAAFTPGQPRLATRDAQELLVPPRKLFVPPNVNGIRGSEHEVADVPEVRRSQNTLRSSADTDVFEDCFGSFRSNDSPPRSFESFKSIDSPSVSGSTGSIRKTAVSLDADEWDSHVSSSFRQELNGHTNDDIPSTSASKFSFKCAKVQQFNKFLRAQKERLRCGLDAGNTDRFSIILTGRDLELSAMVAAMSYAWLQENSFPKVSGDAWHPVPMIDIPRQQMDKHKDAAWLIDACGIDPGSVLFADEIELSVLVGAGRIKMSIIGQDVLVTRNEVGSVCTLLVEMLLAGHRGLLQPRYLKALMLAGILLDTENLDFASIRDIQMSNFLVEGMACIGRTTFYNQLNGADDDARVSKLITQYYDNQPSARLKLRAEAEHEHSDRDSIFTQSQDHTSTSEAGTNSSLDEDSPRPKLKQRNSFRYSRLTPHSAPARSHRLSLPGGCLDQDAQAVAHIRKAAAQSGHPSSALPSYGQNPQRAKPGAFARIRKKLFLDG